MVSGLHSVSGFDAVPDWSIYACIYVCLYVCMHRYVLVLFFFFFSFSCLDFSSLASLLCIVLYYVPGGKIAEVV